MQILMMQVVTPKDLFFNILKNKVFCVYNTLFFFLPETILIFYVSIACMLDSNPPTIYSESINLRVVKKMHCLGVNLCVF